MAIETLRVDTCALVRAFGADMAAPSASVVSSEQRAHQTVRAKIANEVHGMLCDVAQFNVPGLLGEDRALAKGALGPTIDRALSLAATKHIAAEPAAGRGRQIPLSALAWNRIFDILRRELDRAEQDHLAKALPYDEARPPSKESHFRFQRRHSTNYVKRAEDELRIYPTYWEGLWYRALLELPVSDQTKAVINMKLAQQFHPRDVKICWYNDALKLATDSETKAQLIGFLSELGDADAKKQIPHMPELAMTPDWLANAELLAAKYYRFDTATRIAKIERAVKLATSERMISHGLTSRALVKDDIAVCKDAAKRALALDICPDNKAKLERFLAECDNDAIGQAQARAHAVPHDDDERATKRQRPDSQPIKTESQPQPVKREPQPIGMGPRHLKTEPT